jgi:hypothetical protein
MNGLAYLFMYYLFLYLFLICLKTYVHAYPSLWHKNVSVSVEQRPWPCYQSDTFFSLCVCRYIAINTMQICRLTAYNKMVLSVLVWFNIKVFDGCSLNCNVITLISCDIWVFDGGEYENYCLLRWENIQNGGSKLLGNADEHVPQ